MRSIVSVGDIKIGQAEDLLLTHPLGCCLGLTVYDSTTRIGGLLHAMLPLSKINMEKARINPFMFVDTGIPALFEKLRQSGVSKDDWVVKAAGCGNPMGEKEVFKIGKRNYYVLQEMLVEAGIALTAEDVGGTVSRTVQLDLSTGQTIINSNGAKRVL